MDQKAFISAQKQVQSSTPIAGGLLQRKCDWCRKKKPTLQRSAAGPAPETVPPIVHEALRTPGAPLDAQTRAFMEPRFGHDFSRVRVHADAKAAESARAVNALAYTVGRDVVFGAREHRLETESGRRLLGHELAHVVQQGAIDGYQHRTLQLGLSDDALEHQAEEVAQRIDETRSVISTGASNGPVLQRDLARPPRVAPAPVRALTADEIAEAIAFNQRRFRDPYSIRLIRDVMGIVPLPAVIDVEFVQAVVQWQAERRMVQDGQVGHSTTRSFFLELVAEGQYRDAVILLVDSYALPESPHLEDIRTGSTSACCGTAAEPADAVITGGMGSGRPIEICVCRTRIPRSTADYDHFVRIIGHELVHVPHRAAGVLSDFEAYFWEACNEGRAPALNPADRVGHARLALAHFARIPAGLLTPGRIAMRDQLNNLVAAGGVGPCR